MVVCAAILVLHTSNTTSTPKPSSSTKKHLSIAVKLGASEGRAYGNLGVPYYLLEQFQTAIEFEQKAMNIAVELDDWAGQVKASTNLGASYYSLGQFEKAIECQKK